MEFIKEEIEDTSYTEEQRDMIKVKEENQELSEEEEEEEYQFQDPCNFSTGEESFSFTENVKSFSKDTAQRPGANNSFICPECGKSFAHKGHFNEHLKIHTGVKPYVCPHCEKAFTCKGHLKRHIRIHTGERPYTCSECGKSFRCPANLKDHQRSHSGVRAFKCLKSPVSPPSPTLIFNSLTPIPPGTATQSALMICEEDVSPAFRKQKTRKASGLEDVSPACLNICADQLILIFTQIFSRSLEQCEVPKCCTIIPVHKKTQITAVTLCGHEVI
ncbi:oocyte zinc finger protein XlCOF6-like isoform X2 [Xyrauchen texanus]|uniref:oocyte zinc finger protein XlCOF6-like isoform X2 n=1 Tax=Xyrauchen texanus TaxID=154827 RepID=UPI0022429128|nr:oocyte zinc finger protein XlCOF6-like isoform X2 [Xyrauchen texanus]